MPNDLTIYDAAADHWWSGELRWVRTLRNMVPARLSWFDRHFNWRQAQVLDLGCAGGFMSEALHERGAVVTGIDPAAAAIEAARRHARSVDRDIAYDVGFGEKLPYADAQFDAVVCVDVLEHVADLPKVLSEVARVLRPGGIFLFDTINRNAIARFLTITIAERLLGLLPKGTHNPAMFITPRELKSALTAAGFKVGPKTGLGPIGVNLRGDLIFRRLPNTTVIYMGVATKSEAS